MKYKSYKDMSREELLKELDKNLENRCKQGVKVARLDNQHMTICNELSRRNALNLKH